MMKKFYLLLALCVNIASAQPNAMAIGCPTAGSGSSITVCDSDSTPIALFNLLVGAFSGGNWMRMSGTGGTFDVLTGTFTLDENTTDSSFKYTIVGVAPCLDDSSIVSINVVHQPTSVVLSGNQNVCVGLTTAFVASVSGGTWSSSNSAIASVNAITGVVTGIAAGSTTISYLINPSPCVFVVSTSTITVTAPPEQPIMQGYTGICAGSYSTFSANPFGGFWSSSNSAVAMVDNTGFVLGITSGTAIITYTIFGSGGCENKSDSKSVRVTSTPHIVLTSSPSTTNQTVCIYTPIIPITYAVDLLDASGGDASGLPSGLSGSNNANIFTISGTPTQAGSFSYIAHAVGWCGFASLAGNITVLPATSTTLFCDPTQATAPNTAFIDWAPIAGVTNYQYSYSIDNAPEVLGSTTASNYEIANILPGQNVTFTLTNAVGVSCFQTTSTTCSSLANESFGASVFNVFPNPVGNILNVKSPEAIKSIQIFNVLGQQVFIHDYQESELQVDLTYLIRGTYLVKVLTSNTSRTYRILKN
jgi:Secretion system C-terminal sorting domain/Bacterial Ig-like domain (group 2)